MSDLKLNLDAARLMCAMVDEELKALLAELQASPPDEQLEERCKAKARELVAARFLVREARERLEASGW
ncbi:MAG: hypothetical protein JF607_23830 [Burkholderiales bacterium]|jgi:hypothetical protein|nr:hypothetical protein [Burkholderiales bacterium]